ncbi:hypothetical protein M9H77_36422 [Catharanthus roseus]|uniref:Uncharacterized protein n=1 Tax=Catharanthus roseus TaxID=4058 RepID=A0ACB9ZW16_CATRO|nr:hypothetical protein M9H77_36422 [Catharanthus roseus]
MVLHTQWCAEVVAKILSKKEKKLEEKEREEKKRRKRRVNSYFWQHRWHIDRDEDEVARVVAFMVLFCDGTFHAPGFRIAMSKPWKCEAESLKRHSLKDNVYQLMFHLAKTSDRALHDRPWNLDEKLIILRTCDSATQYPPSNFNSMVLPDGKHKGLHIDSRTPIAKIDPLHPSEFLKGTKSPSVANLNYLPYKMTLVTNKQQGSIIDSKSISASTESPPSTPVANETNT